LTSKSVLSYRTRAKHSSILILAIPLLLSAFTHLWNTAGFPAIHPDEGTYMRRAMHALEGLDVQDPASQFDHTQTSNSSFDHPYFGQIFLVSIFSIIGYPDFSDIFANDDIQPIEILYLTPRILMGLLAVYDTFLLYKIASRLYGSKVALIASVLFAVMPLSWILRRIVLDAIALPLILTSIYFMISYVTNNSVHNNYRNTKRLGKGEEITGKNSNSHNILLILLSGIFLGLAIFTKIPALSVIPLMGFLLFFMIPSARSGRVFALWLIPVALIPLIWPAYAISTGDFDEWLNGVLWQGGQRQGEGKTLVDIVNIFVKLDPILFFLGIAGIVFGAIKKDFLPLVWSAPYIFLVYVVGWATHFHWIFVLPVFCIAAALLLVRLSQLALRNNNSRAVRLIPYIAVSSLCIFGFTSTIVLVTSNLSLAQYQAAAFVSQEIKNDKHNRTIISSPIYSWIFRYVLDMDNVSAHIRDSSQPIKTKEILLVVDSTFHHVLSKAGENKTRIELIKTIYNNQTYPVASFRDTVIAYDTRKYPYINMREADIGGGQIVVQENY
jgi:4-amino-4-deoxy-L-arabinose transferase-like glycosyltransferase